MPVRAMRSVYLLGKGGVAERRGRAAAERIIESLKKLNVEERL